MSQSKQTVKVDIYDIEVDKAEQYKSDRELCAEAVKGMMEEFCSIVKRETLDPKMGEAIAGYVNDGSCLMSVLLDPFEVPVMKLALERGNLKTYVLAANGLTEEMALSLKAAR
ncbi:hypothetical protein [uncultured Veillonella sp.]|uniref:hypothetical protein n=1 Tax=uncultured Veillonella sp. TaxID=159268 RepID=UPI0025D42E5E|nr:hypothetical protein [uncultured Veillonella sp.]MDY3973060.1 hypothetical protein [Veillonella caviae]